METITEIYVPFMNLSSLFGIEYATNLTTLYCSGNSLTELDVSNSPNLTKLECYSNQLTELDVSNCPNLTTLSCKENSLTELDVSNSRSSLTTLDCSNNYQLTELDINNMPALVNVYCYFSSLTKLDASNNPALTQLHCFFSQISELNISNTPALENLTCHGNQLIELDVSNNPALRELSCSDNLLTELDVSNNFLLYGLTCSTNQLTELNVSNNPVLMGLICSDNLLTELNVSNKLELSNLSCNNNQITELNVSNNPVLMSLTCSDNLLTELNVSNNLELSNLNCNNNQITELNVSDNLKLSNLSCNNNQLTELDVSDNSLLYELNCSNNKISDITSAYGLNNLTKLDASNQLLEINVPTINNGNLTIDLLKTTAEAGLQLSSNISGTPILNAIGDDIVVSNVTLASFISKCSINFSYLPSALAEGNSNLTDKQFSGTIYLNEVGYLETSLIPEKTKTASNKKVSWTWNMRNTSDVSSEHIKARLSLPNELTIDPTSILINGNPGTLADIDGTNDLGTLNRYETIEITFETTVSGTAGSWLEATGELTWTDSNSRSNEATGSVQIKDDEQTFTPKESNDMALLSTPESFRFGIWDVKNTAQKVNLLSSNYLTNTQVVSDGFYTRLRDDRTTSTGWKLSAELSEFRGSSNELMPNSSGVFLRMEDLTIENIIDKDTPSEAINPSPVGAPSTVVTDETLVAGQTAKTLVSANPGEGMETWQLRIPFDKVSLNLPANAGQKSKNYSATLTWSLDDTP